MKKIAIMTWFQYHNYGTALQVTALSDSIKKMGYVPIVVNYHAKSNPIVKNKNGLFKLACRYVFQTLNNFKKHIFSSEAREDKFHIFYDQHLQFTAECNILSELEALNQSFDAIICGSDQIWSPYCFDPHYFLDFVSDNNKKIAYAPSVGLPTIEDKDIREYVSNLTKEIDHLSTREESGSQIISELCSKDVKTVLDPTFLLCQEDWETYISDDSCISKEPYMLVYMLGCNKAHWKKIYQIANTLKLTVKIIPVFEKDLKRHGCIEHAIGPEEFLMLIKGADYVCTDSFHGMAFSIIFHKNFTIFERFKARDELNQNSRIYNILNKLGLNDRLLRVQADMTMISKKIDYDKVDDIREKLVADSKSFLEESIQAALADSPVQKSNVQKDNTLCCGCGCCKAVCPVDAIGVKRDENGFFSAFINDKKCVSCGGCRKVCPYIERNMNKKIMEGRLYSFKSNSDDILRKSSSGGAAFHISELLSKQGYSVVGCEFNVEEQMAKHIVIKPENNKMLSKLQGSKYMQSEFSNAAEKVYKSDSKFLIIGTPCQIAGIRNLLYRRSNVIYIDLICHGVPSYHLYKKYQDFLQVQKNIDPQKMHVIFRDKRFPWHKKHITVQDNQKSITAHQHKDYYFLAFEHGFCYSRSCYECPWRDKSMADLRLGDYWGKRFSKDKTGVSEIVAMTDVGERILTALKKSECAEIVEQDISDYTTVQQMVNNREPVFWQSYISALTCSDRNIADISEEYILPFEKKERLYKAACRLIGR